MKLLNIVILLTLISCSSSKEKAKQGRCKYDCASRWEESQSRCQGQRGIQREKCLKNAFWKLNDWI